MTVLFDKILIANRGEIACRIMRTANRMNIKTVAVYSDADENALHVRMADEAVHIGPAAAVQSYLDVSKIIAVCQQTGAQAVHPGYGFLSENPGFVEALEKAGIAFIGPSAKAISAMGLKDAAKFLMEKAGVPVVPGYHGANQDEVFLKQQAGQIGYPVLIKARAGGGGKGMRLVEKPDDFDAALQSAKREATASFGDDAVLIEKFISSPRHIEVQVFGDTHGNIVHLYERDCSLQRRHQKVIEEAPAPGMTDDMRRAMTDAAVKAAAAVDYAGAGTVEFIVDGSGPLRPDGFWFMEMNTRLQVEHPVTEAVTGLDLVDWQIRVAAGETLPLMQGDIKLDGHAFEARIYAEDPSNDFLPASGSLTHLSLTADRIDTGVTEGDMVTPYYDPMIAKVITHDQDRKTALGRLTASLQECHIAGIVSNISFLGRLSAHAGFNAGDVDTGLIERAGECLTAPKECPTAIMAALVYRALNIRPAAEYSGFRLWGDAKYRISVNGNSVLLIDKGQGRYQYSGHDFDILEDRDQVLWFRYEGQRYKAKVIQNGNTVTAFYSGDTYPVSIDDPLDVDAQAVASDTIMAPMSGLIKTIDAVAGDKVTTGQVLAVMEAMKMEHALKAPRDGVISAVNASADAQVSEGVVLITLEEE